jgi:septal ring factor EnvC (AmiA/AmiB activator)
MKLNEYPPAIAQTAKTINALDRQIAQLRQDIAHLEGKADLIVAFETTLKNDNQRRARRFEILDADFSYQDLQLQLINLTTEKANAIAQLEYLRNQFSVARLEARWAMAERLIGLEARELVGL